MDGFKSFLGTGWSFPPEFSKVKKGVKMISDEEDIKNSLEVLLATRIGERIMQPGYGCNLDEMMFEPLSLTLQTFIKDLVFTAVYYYEPRVKPEDLTLSSTPEEGEIIIDLSYTVRTTNTRHNLVYPFYIEEGTMVRKQ
jgi:phage baseplate assembly protein W